MKKLFILFVAVVCLIACAFNAQASGTTAAYNVYGILKEGSDKLFTVSFTNESTDIKSAMTNGDIRYISVMQKEINDSFDFDIELPKADKSHNLIINYSGRNYVRSISEIADRYEIKIADSIRKIAVDTATHTINVSGIYDDGLRVELILPDGTSVLKNPQTDADGDLYVQFDFADNISVCSLKVSGNGFCDTYTVDTSCSNELDFAMSAKSEHPVDFNLPEFYGEISGNTEARYNQRVSEIPDEVTVIKPLAINNSNKIYVSASANSNGDGSLEAPFNSIDDALEELKKSQHSSTVVLREGTYYVDDTLVIEGAHNPDGSSGFTAIKGYDGENVTITAGSKLEKNGFVKTEYADGRIYKYDLSDITENVNHDPRRIKLYMKGIELKKSRWPEESEVMMGDIIYGGPNVNGVNDPDADPNVIYKSLHDKPFNWDLTRGIFFNGALAATGRWDTYNIRVSTANSSTREIKLNGYSWVGQAKGNNEGITHFYENVFEELDTPGEWSIDVSNGILYIYTGENIDLSDIFVVSGAHTIAEVSGAENIVFDNITFKYASGAIAIEDSKGIIIQNCEFEGFTDDAVLIERSTYCGVINSSITSVGNNGVKISGFDSDTSMWESDELYNLIPTRNFVQNNTFGDCGYTGVYATYGIGDIISHNVIANMQEAGIILNYSVESIVEYNEIADFGTDVWDCGAVYCGGIPLARGNHIRYNYIHDSLAGGVGIYFDGMTSGSLAYGNTIINVKNPFSINGGREVAIVNNIVANDADAVHSDGINVFVSGEDYRGDTSHNESLFIPKFISEDGDIQRFMNSRAFNSQMLMIRYPEMFEWLSHISDMLELRAKKGTSYKRASIYTKSDPENLSRAPYDIYIAKNALEKSSAFETDWLMDLLWPISGKKTNMQYSDINQIGFENIEEKDFALTADAGIYGSISGFKTIPFEKTGLKDTQVALGDPTVYVCEYFEQISDVLQTEKSAQTVIKWKKVSGAHLYRVVVATDKEFKNIVYSDITYLNTYTVPKLLSNDRYYAKVTACTLSKSFIGDETDSIVSYIADESIGEKIVLLSAEKDGNDYTFTLKNNSEEEKNLDLYVALRKGNDMICCQVLNGVEFKGNQEITKTVSFNGEGTIVLYVWNSSLVPQRKAVTLH